MFADVRRDRLSCWKLVADIFIFFFILRGVASLTETNVPERGRNKTCSLTLTRQKVLIQEVESPENSVKKRRTGRKYGNDNRYGYTSPDIVVEEFHIRAKINFQARPRTCRDTLTEISNDKKSRIGSSSSRDRGIVYCRAESLIKKKNAKRVDVESSIAPATDRSIGIEKENASSESTAHLPNKLILNGTGIIKLVNDEESTTRDYEEKIHSDHREVAKSAKKADKEFFSKKKKKLQRFTNDRKEFIRKTRFDYRRIYGMKNEGIDEPKAPSVFCDSEEKSRCNYRETDKSGFHPRYRRSTKGMKNEAIDPNVRRNSRLFVRTGASFFGVNKDHFTHGSKGFLASDKVDKASTSKINLENREVISMTDNKVEMENTNVLPFFDDYEIVEIKTNKLDGPGPLSVPYKLKKKLHEDLEAKKKLEVPQGCRGNSTKNYKTVRSRLKRREANIDAASVKSLSGEQEKFYMKNDRFDNSTAPSVSQNSNETLHDNSVANSTLSLQTQEKKSLTSLKSNTSVTNKNGPKKTSKQSASKNKKKKSRSESSSKKLQSRGSKATASKALDSTKTNATMEKRSNNTVWNFAMPPVIAKYFTFISSMFGIGATGDKNRPAEEKIDRTILSNVSDENSAVNASTTDSSTVIDVEIFQNSTSGDDRPTLLRHEIDETTVSNLTDEKTVVEGKKIQSVTKNFLQNSTGIDRAIFRKHTVLNSTRNPDDASNKTGSPVSPKMSRKTIVENDVRFPAEGAASKNVAVTVPSKAFGEPQKIVSEDTLRANNYSDVLVPEKLSKIEDKNFNVTDSRESTTNAASKDFSNFSISTIDENGEKSPTTVKYTSDMSILRSSENEEKLTKLEESMKFTQSSTGNMTKTSREATSEKIEEYPEKTTLNFTIIDPNCTEAFVQNSLTNSSMDGSSSIVEAIARASTYPTIWRYSRNDSAVDNTGSTKNDLIHVQNNTKNRQTKNSLSDPNLPNGPRRGRVGAMTRGRMRSRYKGKDQHPSLPRVGKNPWRKNDVSATLNFSKSPNLSTRPGNHVGTLAPRVNGGFAEKPLSGGFPDLTTLAPLNADYGKINATVIEETLLNDKSTLSIATEMTTNDIPRPTELMLPAIEDFTKEDNNSRWYLKKEFKPSSLSSSTDFSTIEAIRTNSTFRLAASKQEEDRIVGEVSTEQKLTTESSTVTYDKTISSDPAMSTILPKANPTVSNSPTDSDTARRVEIISNEFDPVNSKEGDFKESFTNGSIFEILPPAKPPLVSSESKRLRDSTSEIVDNTVSSETFTLSYDKSSFAFPTIVNEIESPSQKKITTSESPSITENEISTELKNTRSTADESVGRENGRVVTSGSTQNKNIADRTADEKSKISSVSKKPIELKYSTTQPYENGESDDSPVNSQIPTEIYFPPKINTSPQIRDENLSARRELSVEREKIIPSKNHVTTRLPDSPANSSLHLENKTEVSDTSIGRYPDSTGQEFFSKEEYANLPAAESSPLLSSSKVVRRARDSRATSDYDDRREPEMDYDIDGSVEVEAITEETLKHREDNAEKRSGDPGKLRNALLPYRRETHGNVGGPRASSARSYTTGSTRTDIETSGGILTPKNPPTVVGLPHSAVHEVFFDDSEAGGDSESTVIPAIHKIRDDQSLPASTERLTDSFNIPYELLETPDNLTNFLDESKLLEFVESLEDFLFDDSVTGTSDHKPLPSSNQDLLAESTDSNPETRSAIFKTKKFSTENKKRIIGKNSKRSKNEISKDSSKSEKKKQALSSIGRRIRRKNVKRKIGGSDGVDKKADKKFKRDRLKDKYRQVKISKTLMDSSDRRKGVRNRNSTDRIHVKKKV